MSKLSRAALPPESSSRDLLGAPPREPPLVTESNTAATPACSRTLNRSCDVGRGWCDLSAISARRTGSTSVLKYQVRPQRSPAAALSLASSTDSTRAPCLTVQRSISCLRSGACTPRALQVTSLSRAACATQITARASPSPPTRKRPVVSRPAFWVAVDPRPRIPTLRALAAVRPSRIPFMRACLRRT